MRARRWAVLAGLAAVVAWLHGWGAVQWDRGLRAETVPAAARPAAVQVVWPPPSAVEPAPVAAVAEATPVSRVPNARPARAPGTASATPSSDRSAPPDRFAAAAARALPLDPAVPPAPPETDTAASAQLTLNPDALHTVATADLTATEATSPIADRPRPTVPTYRTRIPPAALVSYRMSRSGLAGTGELDWRPEGSGYSLRLEGQLPVIGTLITQISRGRFDAAGLAPERFTDKRLRRAEQAANFQREEGSITFSGQSPSVPLTPGVQDRLSVMVQLAAIAAAWNKPPTAGTPVLVRVVGARGDASVWSLRFLGPDTVDTPQGPVAALHFLREGDSPHDTRADYWLDPARSHLPVRVRITDGGSDPFELLRLK